MTNNSKIKNSCCRHDIQEESLAMAMVKDYRKTTRKWFVVIMVLLMCWFSTIGLFVWYLNQYDFISKKYNVEIIEARGGENCPH